MNWLGALASLCEEGKLSIERDADGVYSVTLEAGTTLVAVGESDSLANALGEVMAEAGTEDEDEDEDGQADEPVGAL